MSMAFGVGIYFVPQAGGDTAAIESNITAIQDDLIVDGNVTLPTLNLVQAGGTFIPIDLQPLLDSFENIYNADGTLTGTRTVNQNGNELIFSGGAYNTVTSKGNAAQGGVFKVQSTQGNSQFYSNGTGWGIWNSVSNIDTLSYSPATKTIILGNANSGVKTNLWVKAALRDVNNSAGNAGDLLTSTSTGVAWVTDDTVKHSELGTGMDDGTFEPGKINPKRWDNEVGANTLASGQVPNGVNRVIAYNGGYSSTVTLPTAGNFVGEQFIINSNASLNFDVLVANTNLTEPLTMKQGDVLTAVWSGRKWDIVTRDMPQYIYFKPDTQMTTNNVFKKVVLGAAVISSGLTYDSATDEVVVKVSGTYRMTADFRIRLGSGGSNQNAFRFYKNGAIQGGSTTLEPNTSTYVTMSKTQLIKCNAGDRLKIGFKGQIATATYNSVSINKI